ncbi:MAG: hypothetical protein KGJ89_00980 [Patescibacteria group bacterium]|nr:hypothetical protein [Patescibacteria group bacterium]MDE2015087.1 hypothetical protein [Patescibacteria group bacterium]MDE2226515.1 hypothetical protein [Patescibacteria group bacterium]
MENEELNFAEFLRERIKDTGINIKKLSDASGIAVKHLEGMLSGNLENLPSAPYFRGYLIRLGEILNFDFEPWWSSLKNSGAIKGAHAPLPKNRFVRKSIPKIAWVGTFVAIIIIYFLFQYSHILGKPEITLISPSGNPALSLVNQVDISGSLNNGGTLYINGEQISINKDGTWSKMVLLQTGINSLKITAKKFLGGETSIMEQIIYQPQTTSSAPAQAFNQYN